jgi:3-methyladenine DNA glycosylase/8-oxoguanine DNA glycosylase
VRGVAARGGEVRVEVTPPWPFRLTRRSGMDGLAPVRNGVLQRLVHEDERPIHIRVAQLRSGNVLFGAQAQDRGAAVRAIERMRRALGVDLDLRPFHDAFRRDPLIGSALRADPTLRPAGRPHAFEALAWAVTEQLIEYERAVAIQRRMVAALGRRDPVSGLRDSPSAAVLGGGATAARLESFDLSAGRAIALIKASRAIAAGRIDVDTLDPDAQEEGWRRLRAIRGIGSWTVEIMALTGQGRLDQIPAGDLGFVKFVGRLRSGGDRYARASEDEVRECFAPYGAWQGLAGIYALSSAPVPSIRGAARAQPPLLTTNRS